MAQDRPRTRDKNEKRIREATEAADRAGRIYAGLRSHIPPSCGQAESRTQCYAVREKGIAHPSPTGHHQKCFWKNDAQVVNDKKFSNKEGQCLDLRKTIETGTYYPHHEPGRRRRDGPGIVRTY